jgi:hypothetical protein
MKQYLGYQFNPHPLANNNIKLTLEDIYYKYCMSELESIIGEEDIEMLKQFVKFRLSVSGGSESSMGSVGCGSIGGFLNEISLFDDMMCDWGGCYRGDFSSECLDSLIELLEEVTFEQDVDSSLNIKELIIEGYKEINGMNEDEDGEY